MKRRDMLLAVLAAPLASYAQAPGRQPRRIGFLGSLVEGRDLALDLFNAQGDVKAIAEAARRFERERVAMIWAVPSSAAIAVNQVTANVPVVFCMGSDPIAAGLVKSFARPGGRFTGVHFLTSDLTGKRLEVLKELLPKLTRVIVIYNPDRAPPAQAMKGARAAAAKLHVQMIERHVRSEAELRAAAAAIKPGEADAFFYIPDAMVATHLEAIIERARAIRLPTMVHDEGLAERGALASYGIDSREVGRQSAKHVQRVLSGASPSDLPVENVTHIVFVLNRRTAKEIGLRVSREMLVRFDRVIE